MLTKFDVARSLRGTRVLETRVPRRLNSSLIILCLETRVSETRFTRIETESQRLEFQTTVPPCTGHVWKSGHVKQAVSVLVNSLCSVLVIYLCTVLVNNLCCFVHFNLSTLLKCFVCFETYSKNILD